MEGGGQLMMEAYHPFLPPSFPFNPLGEENESGSREQPRRKESSGLLMVVSRIQKEGGGGGGEEKGRKRGEGSRYTGGHSGSRVGRSEPA